MFGSTFGGGKIDSKHVKLILTCFDYASKIVASNSKIEIQTQISCSTHFYIQTNIDHLT